MWYPKLRTYIAMWKKAVNIHDVVYKITVVNIHQSLSKKRTAISGRRLCLLIHRNIKGTHDIKCIKAVPQEVSMRLKDAYRGKRRGLSVIHFKSCVP